MNKSIYLFIGGSLFGVIAALAIVKSTTDTEQTVALPANTPNMNIRTVKMQQEAMKNGEVEESASDMQVRLSQQPGTQGMNDMQNTSLAETPTAQQEPMSKTKITQVQPTLAVTAPIIPPTEEQVSQYNDIDSVISSAANNPTIKLVDLIRQSDSLTVEQRNRLTQKTLDMLSRGELTVEQFAKK